MTKARLIECSFLVPMRRDANLSDGEPHAQELWDWLDEQLYNRFGGRTTAPGYYEGFYRDPDTQQRVSDQSTKYIVAVRRSEIEELRSMLSVVCLVFHQKCIYLNIAGSVEFIEAPSHGS